MKLHDWLLERAKNARGLATGLDGSRVTERKPNGEPSNYARGVEACPKGKGICGDVAPEKRCFTCPVPDQSIQDLRVSMPTAGVAIPLEGKTE